MKKAIDFFTAHPARFFLLAALLWGGLMCLVSIIRGKFDLDGLLVEANGMVFDLLVFGVLLSIYERLRESAANTPTTRRWRGSWWSGRWGILLRKNKDNNHRLRLVLTTIVKQNL
jgi:hypothetical protein